MRSPSIKQKTSWLFTSVLTPLNTFTPQLIFISAALLLLLGLGAAPVYILDEAKNAQTAREMLEQKEWIVPTFNGTLRSHKPPLHYYFMQLSYTFFGVNAFGARFFSAIMGWLTVWITWYFVKKFIGKQEASWAAVTLLLSTHFLFEFRLAVPDPYLIFFVTAGTLCFHAYVMENRMKWLMLSAIAIALAILAKGPVALALPGLSVICWTLMTKRFPALLSFRMILYFLTILAVAAPWYVAVHIATDGAFSREFFFTHNVGRFKKPMEDHGGNIALIPVIVFTGLLPLSVFAVNIFKSKSHFQGNALWQLSLYVAVITILFFSISGTKLPNYPMSCYPFVAILVGCCLARLTAYHPAGGRDALWVLLFLSCGLFVGGFVALSFEKALKNMMMWPLIFLIPIIATAIALRQQRKKGIGPALVVISGGYALFNLVALSLAYPALYQQNPVAKTVHLFQPGEQVYAYKRYNSAYNFYLDNPIIVLSDKKSLQELLARSPNAKIISRENELAGLAGIPIKVIASENDLFETPTTVIFCAKIPSGYEASIFKAE
ncbi:ArnT family glycosyltransferase [Parapedobacter koreensis]|uniref:4-amino-4-deoxy-L-arabinose transferase n=1 Tax=Parapedobacter koreensis TaxID=332977 RepID=A0A1H7I7H8_9SPHI|nr:glycosyltransferase family 39 protein [Parapedobacter koreensis]SEK58388.1 4-amino-4-deoxy-L-arabinose transferase [Parapedobacter koreensis]